MSSPASPKRDLPLIEVTVSAPADVVWNALRDPAVIQQWFGWDAETLPAEIQQIFIEHAAPSDAERILRWNGLDDRFEVEARGETSVLRLVRPAPAEVSSWDEIFEDVIQGWIAFVVQLQHALERHRGARRRTFHFIGTPRTAGAPLAARALGLPDAPSTSARYAAASAPGDALAGDIRYRGRHTVAVGVEAWGDGLLVAIDGPATDRHPTGRSMVIATTYGLDDAAFEALSERWAAWWNGQFAPVPPAPAPA